MTTIPCAWHCSERTDNYCMSCFMRQQYEIDIIKKFVKDFHPYEYKINTNHTTKKNIKDHVIHSEITSRCSFPDCEIVPSKYAKLLYNGRCVYSS